MDSYIGSKRWRLSKYDWISIIEQASILLWSYIVTHINDIELFLEDRGLESSEVMLIVGALLFFGRKLYKDYSHVIDTKALAKVEGENKKVQEVLQK